MFSTTSSTIRKTYVMRGAARARALDVYHLIFAPTHACNLRCRHCYLPDHHGYTMPFARVASLIEQWEQIVLRDRGPLGGYFHLKGGEPLIVPYLVDVLDLLAEKATLRFMMTTNGTLLRTRDVEALCRLHDAVKEDVIIIVSLDGSHEALHKLLRGPNQFGKTVQFARALADAGLNLHFNYVVHAGNIDDVPAFVSLAEQLGATQVNFLPMVPKGYGLEMGEAGRPDPEKLHNLLVQLYRDGDPRRKALLAGNYAHILDLEQQGVHTSCECVAGYKGLLYITPEGDVFSCPNLVTRELKLGNCLETPLAEIHDINIDHLYEGRMTSQDVDDRYLCRGERMTRPHLSQSPPPDGLSLPVLGQATSGGNAYPDPARRLQEILLREGIAASATGRGISYCFSRNF